MKFETKLLCDRLFGHALCLFLMPFVFIAGKILRIDHSINPQHIRQIAVAKYFGLGSITHSMPALKALKEKYPAAGLIFISRKANQSLFPFIPFIDEAVYIDDSSALKLFKSTVLLFIKLWRKRIDLFFDLEVFSAYGVLISLFSLARNRFGFFWTRSTKFKTYIYTHLLYFNFQMPVRLSYMQLARLGGADINASCDLLPFNLPHDISISAREKLQNLIGDMKNYQGILAINPNASELSYARRWDIKNFAQTASHFADLGYCIVLLGSQDERTWTGKVFDFVEKRKGIFNAAGLFSLGEVLAFFLFCDAFLTNDSGLMNLAFAQGAKVVSLFGNNMPSFVHIDNGVNIAIYKPSYCSPCLYIFDKAPCGDKPFCMENIKAEDTIDAVSKILETKDEKRPVKDKNAVINEQSKYLFGTLRKEK